MPASLPFRIAMRMREEDINHLGSLRLGLLLGDLDAFAGQDYAHCRGPEKPPALVTAAIDTIDIFVARRRRNRHGNARRSDSCGLVLSGRRYGSV